MNGRRKGEHYIPQQRELARALIGFFVTFFGNSQTRFLFYFDAVGNGTTRGTRMPRLSSDTPRTAAEVALKTHDADNHGGDAGTCTPRPRTCTPDKVGVGGVDSVCVGVGVDGLVTGWCGRGERGRRKRGCGWCGRKCVLPFLIPN